MQSCRGRLRRLHRVFNLADLLVIQIEPLSMRFSDSGHQLCRSGLTSDTEWDQYTLIDSHRIISPKNPKQPGV